MISVDHNIPLPPRPIKKSPKSGKPMKYPWLKMKMGDSFFVPYGALPANGKKTTNDVYVSTQRGKILVPGSKWSIRTVTENGVKGVRIWRVV